MGAAQKISTNLLTTSGKTIAVECKFHSYFYKGKYGDPGTWWRKEQGQRYRAYGAEYKIPVFVAIGIGGSPKNPQRLFFCPLEKLNDVPYGFITESDLKQFERKHGVQFFTAVQISRGPAQDAAFFLGIGTG
jgi:hypothetical protein